MYVRSSSVQLKTKRKDAYVEIDVFDVQRFEVSFEPRFDVAMV